jgi:hypothetical protein
MINLRELIPGKMKKCICIIVVVMLKFLNSNAQNQTPGQLTPDTSNILNNNRYDCVAINGDVAEMSATDDSLIITYTNTKMGRVDGKDRYKIINREIRGSYIVIPVKMNPISLTLVTPKGKRKVDMALYGVFVLHFEPEKSKLMVLHDGRLWFTPRAALATYETIRLRGEYFNSWYLTSRFERFTQYPDLNNADKAVIETILVDWGKRIIEHASKKVNTYNTDRFGADYGRDNFTRSLINHHLNPMATMEDFVSKLKEYNFKMQPNNQPSPQQLDSLKKIHPTNESGSQEI